MDLKEEFEQLAESDFVKRRNIRSKSSLALALLGWLIIGSALNSVIFASLPLKVAAVDWQLNLIGSLLSASFNFLIGATLIIITQLFNTKERILQNWQILVSRLAALFTILLLLFIPLQFALGSRALRQQSIPITQEINKLKGVVDKISGMNSEPELRAFLTSLPNIPALPDKFNAPFPVIKKRAIDNLKASINLATNNADLQKTQRTKTFLKEAARNTAQAILMASAFSILANLNPKASNVFTRFLGSLMYSGRLIPSRQQSRYWRGSER